MNVHILQHICLITDYQTDSFLITLTNIQQWFFEIVYRMYLVVLKIWLVILQTFLSNFESKDKKIVW